MGGLVAGAIAVVCLTVAAILIRPSLAADLSTSGNIGATTTASAGPSSATTQVTPTGKTVTATIRAKDMTYVPNVIQVHVGDRLRVVFVNDDTQSHDLVFSNGASAPTLAPGARHNLDVGIVAGDMQGWCSLAGHREMGMSLSVKATGNGAADGANGAGSDAGTSATGNNSGSNATAADAPIPSAAALKQQAKAEQPYPAELPALEPGTVHNVTLTVTEHTQQLASGVTRQIWTYNGSTPGPVLHGRVGDTFNVTLVNKGSMGHSIDFHAGTVAPDQPMRTIAPGQSLRYSFAAARAGVWMYHCSTAPMSNHIANGMFGAVVIEPKNLPPVDHSYVLIQSELYLGANGKPADATKIANRTPDLMAFNGRPFQYDAHPLQASAGQRIRIWALDAGPNESWAFHVVGTQFDTVWTEGAYSIRNGFGGSSGAGTGSGQGSESDTNSGQAPSTTSSESGTSGAQELPLLPAQGGFVEFTPTEPGHYSIVNHEMSLAEKGAHGTLDVS
ncbi:MULTISPECIES: multicopper oxidase domain-containing protein [Bifidobacterium]|jgi:nitrite reductase (NO-forming)|nr:MULTISPECIES: multicopper oxidase domain-containing protein [Bifidobacterium]MCI1649473.1 multicopper oxidase domain-containing protein [Bifidobacterium tibiigranuli]MCI1674564.1 multicopper oxidase domain-containing protein [Bifidobacterium tibiigranuli]MCI1714148.1 multicopper oxidase domain-containing protein [Bifidobacterium tibiigranuli]MCI2186165.1 multicopper oxidase domain-containing protein [Bifidobacterium tibiigranuli]MCI2204008.1 multicopper oxidase domain-containing protein [Bi